MIRRILVIDDVARGDRQAVIAWIAASDEECSRGLAGVAELAPLEGMLLMHVAGGVLTMAGMRIPIDAVLVGRDGYVRGVVELPIDAGDVPIPAGVEHVLELGHGVAVALGIGPGSRVSPWQFVRTNPRAPARS